MGRSGSSWKRSNGRIAARAKEKSQATKSDRLRYVIKAAPMATRCILSIAARIRIRICRRFFAHYKDLERNKWSDVREWIDVKCAERIIMEAIERAKSRAQ